MLQKYVLIENKQIAISVGDKINGLTKKIKWKNQYSAIKDAIDQGFYPCLDFAWVAENNGFAEFYDDNYRNNSGENTLTRCWFVMENEKKITELYLSYNMLNYEFINARNYTYKRCARRLCRFWFFGCIGGYYCKRYRK